MKKILLSFAFTMSLVCGMAQNSLYFDGTNDYVETTFEGVLGENNRTFEAWIYVPSDAPASNLAILDYGQNAVGSRNTFLVSGTRGLSFISGGVDANIGTGPGAIPEDVWTHVAFVLNAGTGFLYVNGLEMVTGSLTTVDTPSGEAELTIGQRVAGGSIIFEGNIDEVRIWDIARTADEIATDMVAELCELPENLVAYYRFNEGTAGGVNTGITVLPDLISGNDGDLINFALSGAVSNWVEGMEDFDPGFSIASQDIELCSGESIEIGGSTYDATGEYVNILESLLTGCDSVLTTNLTVLEEIEISQDIVLCIGEVLIVGDSEYIEAGYYTDLLESEAGCDSTVNTNLSFYAEIEVSQDIILCIDEVLIVGESEYDEAGFYSDLLTSEAGCDSVVNTTLSFYAEIESSQDIVLCPGEVLIVGDSEYDASGDYIDVLESEAGCDSTVNTSLSYYDEIEFSQDIVLCEGESVVVGESVYTEAGEYIDVLVSELTGCDSMVISSISLVIIDVSTTLSDFTITSNQAGATYQWVDCDNDYLAISGETDQDFTADEAGNYAVIVTVDGCSDTTECATISGVGVETFEVELFQFYPNPTSAQLNLLFEDNNAVYKVNIYSILGELIISQNAVSGTVVIDMVRLPKGTYVLNVIGEDRVQNRQFIKE